MALDAITSDLDTVEVADYVRKAQEFQGSGLFMFVLERAVKHVKERAGRGNSRSPFATRVPYEQILAVAFKSMWKEKQETYGHARLEVLANARQVTSAAEAKAASSVSAVGVKEDDEE